MLGNASVVWVGVWSEEQAKRGRSEMTGAVNDLSRSTRQVLVNVCRGGNMEGGDDQAAQQAMHAR